jgi:methyl-accepting chemotaxis protein
MFQWLKSWKLETKISVIVIVLVFLALSAVGIISFDSASAALLNSYQDSLTTNALQTAQIIGDKIEKVKTDMQKTADEITDEYGDISAEKALINSQKETTGFESISFMGTDGASISTDENIVDYSKEPGYQKALNGEVAISEPFYRESDKKLYFMGFVPIKSIDGSDAEVKGVLVALIKYDDLYNTIASVKIGKTGYAQVLDQTGTVMMHPNQDNVINKENLLASVQKDVQLKQLRDILQKAIDRETGFEQFANAGSVKFVSYAPIPNTSWQLILQVPKNELFEQIDRQINTIIFTSSVALIIILITVLAFMRTQVSKPIKKLIGYANCLAKGDVDVDVKSKAKDEIGALYQSFGSMVEGIKERANVIEQLANGDMDVSLAVRSDKDVLSQSIQTVISTFKNLAVEFEALISATKEGDYSAKGDTCKFKGQYAVMLTGVNSIIEEADRSLAKIKESLKQNNKQKEYMQEEIKKLIVNFEKFSQGILSFELDVSRSDEDMQELYELFMRISQGLSTSITAIKGYISEISDVLNEVSGGNLVVSIKSEYLGEFIQLKYSINNIVKALNGVLLKINVVSEQVALGTHQVSEGNQAISQGATEQASAIEELTATVTQIADQTRQNAVNANSANELAMNVKEYAVAGNEQMNNMRRAMEEINISSANISMIIKVIDDIASETNILALNAAVEAARAGVHGKGFAVVAEEVRTLAARSAEAAKDTTAMIESSIKRAEAGTKLAIETAQSLSMIVDGVEKVAELMSEIAVASNEQATGIAQVNKGFEQMSQVVQHNSASSQEGAAASEDLSGHAELLKSMVSLFKLDADS